MTINLISNLISSRVSDYFVLDPSYTIIIASILSSVMYQEGFSDQLYMVVPFLIVTGSIYYYLITYKSDNTNDGYSYLDTYNGLDMLMIEFMVKEHPEFMDKHTHMVSGNPIAEYVDNIPVSLENVNVPFNDVIHDVRGYFRISYTIVSKGKDDNTEHHKCLRIAVHKECDISPLKYLSKISKYRDECILKSREESLWLVKVMYQDDEKSTTNGKTCNHYISLYNGPKSTIDKRYNEYMKTYFSGQREKLWKYFSNVHFHPEKFTMFGQAASINMLLHGPPGTGKSTFVYRLAMCLGRHIVSVDLTAIGSNRSQVYQIIQNPMVHEMKQKPEKVIILLEEFDIAVKYLYDKKNMKLVTHTISKETKKEEKTECNMPRSTREFELEDLLEILQGPVPIPGSMIIATSNKYEEMYSLCPALFRPGRLTPIHVNYMEWSDLQEMSEYYFDRKVDIPKENIGIPTSQIMELALNASLYGDSFDRFQKDLKHALYKSKH